MDGCKATVLSLTRHQCSIHWESCRVVHGASKRTWGPQTTRHTPKGVQRPSINESEPSLAFNYRKVLENEMEHNSLIQHHFLTNALYRTPLRTNILYQEPGLVLVLGQRSPLNGFWKQRWQTLIARLLLQPFFLQKSLTFRLPSPFLRTLLRRIHGCGAGTQISESSSRHLNISAPAPNIRHVFGSGSRTNHSKLKNAQLACPANYLCGTGTQIQAPAPPSKTFCHSPKSLGFRPHRPDWNHAGDVIKPH